MLTNVNNKFFKYFVVVTCPALILSNGGVSYNTNATNGGYRVDTVLLLLSHAIEDILCLNLVQEHGRLLGGGINKFHPATKVIQ